MVEYLIWDSIEPLKFLFSVLHVQIGLVDNIINWMHGWIDERVEKIKRGACWSQEALEQVGSQPYTEVPCTCETCTRIDEEGWWFGDMLEDHVEKSHQDMNKFHQRVATLRSYEIRAEIYSHHEKTANDPGVVAAGKRAIDIRQVASGTPMVQVW
jgi:hypothetical protein